MKFFMNIDRLCASPAYRIVERGAQTMVTAWFAWYVLFHHGLIAIFLR